MMDETIFDIASLTKFYTAIFIYIAFEEGKLDINDTIYSIDSRFINMKDVSILDLLCHRVRTWIDGLLSKAKDKKEFYQILFSAYKKKNQRIYIDTNYIILSTVLEKTYNKKYNEILKEFCEKYDLKNTFYGKVETAASCNYDEGNGEMIDDRFPGFPHDPKALIAYKHGISTGHAGIFTKADDLVKIFELLFKDKVILKNKTIDFMFKHDNIDKENEKFLDECAIENKIDIKDLSVNEKYNKLEKFLELNILKNYNYFGVKYRNLINKINDISDKASDKTIYFSGYTGPAFLFDYEKGILILLMCNICHMSKLTRKQRYDLTVKLIKEVY